jgi:hypothetical protein
MFIKAVLLFLLIEASILASVGIILLLSAPRPNSITGDSGVTRLQPGALATTGIFCQPQSDLLSEPNVKPHV